VTALVMSHCESVDSDILTTSVDGASKGALDRIVTAAAVELADRGVRANVINPGPIDTGWMSDEIREWCLGETPAGRLGSADDVANLVRFLLSSQGSWINGQTLYSNGGFAPR
jgi:3-oxoacyl-[acyl-carrier protein] reductase